MSVVDPLPAGSFTLTGKTFGPAVNIGRCRYGKSQMMYFHLDEIRDATVKAGWHTEADYQQLAKEHAIMLEHYVDLQNELVDADEKIDALERALGWKPTGETTNGDGEDRERQLQEGRPAPDDGNPDGTKDPSVKTGSGKGRKVRASGRKAG